MYGYASRSTSHIEMTSNVAGQEKSGETLARFAFGCMCDQRPKLDWSFGLPWMFVENDYVDVKHVDQ